MLNAPLSGIEQRWPPDRWRDTTVVVGVSGGPDSVALLCRLAELRPPDATGRLVAAHFDHRWRPAAGANEARFVEQLARQLGIECVCGAAEDRPSTTGRTASSQGRAGHGRSGLGREGEARRARYAFFERVVRETGARYLAVGHTRDDQVETVLHRLVRGSGFHGLRGMAPSRAWIDGCSLVRPLLDVPRSEIVAYLEARRQPYLADPSNADRSLTRNRIRRELLPLLRRDYNSDVDAAILRIARRSDECLRLVAEQVDRLFEMSGVQVSSDEVRFDVAPVLDASRSIRTEFLRSLWRSARWPERKMTELHWHVMTDDLETPGTTRSLPAHVVFRHEGRTARLTRTR